MSTKDTYLYFQTRDRLSCVNISQLCDKRCPNPRELTIVYDNSECKYPVGMGYVIVDSKLYMIGGEIVKLKEGASIDDRVEITDDIPPDWLNLEDVYAFDPNDSSLVKCPSSKFPRMLAPKTKPLVVTLEDNKVYVLSTHPHLLYTRMSDLPRPLFEVFDPVVKTWKPLPDPPAAKHNPCYLDLRVLRHFSWGHTLVICTRLGKYAFDAREQRWYDTQGQRIFDIFNDSAAVTKLKGFVIVLPRSCYAIHAFPITDDDDDDDVPASSSREPLEIYDLYRAIGTPFVDCGDGYIFHLDEHRLCFLIDGNDSNDKWCAKVAIFRFSTITSPPGLSFELEAVQIYPMEHMNISYQWLHNAFIMKSTMAAVQSAVSNDPSVNVPEPQKPVAQPPQSSSGLPEHVMYKNRLQEYTQRSALPLPMYLTFNEGAQHAPKFRSTVLVDGKHFTSLNTFSHRKEAEQDVSRIALLDISPKLKNERSPVIVKVTVFCKSILNEYAVKRNLEKPTYQTTQTQGLLPIFVSVLVFDGITYTGDTGRSKKEAEQLGARAAILSILDSEYGTVIYEIIKSKSNRYVALNIVKDSHNIHNGMMHWEINIGNGLSSNMPIAGSAGNMPIAGSAGNMSAVGSACSLPIFGNASNMPIAAMSEPYLGQTTTILAAHPPFHEFKKPTIEPPTDAIIPPIVFVPPTLQHPILVSSTSSKKRKRKNKKNVEEKVQVISQLPVVVSSNQIPSCSVA